MAGGNPGPKESQRVQLRLHPFFFSGSRRAEIGRGTDNDLASAILAVGVLRGIAA
jgi:hypothetical protein